ncbi:uncharacterized protein LOC109948300 isoform X1 [Prunus persica]|uniref:uncharacterized protein LOC109948300 isoform X1 n=1 Tax=Prunus persica TaxID=3760 RepID=UPI0009ABA030|nr:uncharacterized protein LOC109948300 isoform X1 [Prunus persica]
MADKHRWQTTMTAVRQGDELLLMTTVQGDFSGQREKRRRWRRRRRGNFGKKNAEKEKEEAPSNQRRIHTQFKRGLLVESFCNVHGATGAELHPGGKSIYTSSSKFPCKNAFLTSN